jgi:TonB family protein
MGTIFAFAAAAAAFAVQATSPAQPALLEPSGPWTVEYAESMCIVGRNFGTGKQEVTLGFRPGPMGDHIRVALLLSDDGQKYSFGTANLSIDGLPPVPAPFGRGPIPIKGMHLVKIDTKRSEIGDLAAAKQLQVQANKLAMTFKLGNIAGAMKELQKCERDLLIEWGMDPVALDSMETPAFHRNILMVFRTSDYPSSAISGGEQGTAGVRYRIGVDGKVSDCRVVEKSGSPTLDAQTCAIITRRVRYEPAKTNSGQPVASIGFQRIRWELPHY